MSRAFTKEDGAEPPPFVAPRAPLPAGVPNYVTPRGLALLRSELVSLEASRSSIPLEASADAAPLRAALQTRIQELKARLASTVLVDTSERRCSDEVRFGARVMVQGDSKQARQIDIVGVDEADATSGRIAFVAPLARALLGKRPGDVVTFRTPRGEEELEVVSVNYVALDIGEPEA
jgi:transcription elongation factor GreB